MKAFGLLIAILAVCGCSLAPRYQVPFIPPMAQFKETGRWLPANAKALVDSKKPWWELFQDPILNDLEAQMLLANQDLKSAFARFQEAGALVTVARSGLYPFLKGLINADRQKTSTTIANPDNMPLFNDYLAGADISYELDVFGRVRNLITQNTSLALASNADLAALTLSLQASLANNYLTLRGYDEAQRVLDRTVKAYTKALYLTKKRHEGGVAPIADVDEALTQLDNAKTAAEDMRLIRTQREHAIAVLLGRFPLHFSLPPGHLPKHFFVINPDIPSTLLERRPDIAAAAFRVQAANANIGIARAAFFPDFNLSSIGGFESQSLSNLFSKASLFWSLGPTNALTLIRPLGAMTLFDGGKLVGLLRQAKASYFETVANYRQIALIAVQQVEDNLVAMRRLTTEIKTQSEATAAAERALKQAQNRYQGGIITYLEVVVLENTALQSELALVNIKTRRHLATVLLIKALGGSPLC